MSTRAALVTGGSAGIGLAIATMLVDEGWSVTIVGRDRDKLQAAADRLGTERVHVVAANLAEDVAEDVVADHLRHHGRLDLLVNNAGAGLIGPIQLKSAKELDVELNLNLRSAVRLVQESLPPLRVAALRDGASWIVNVSSMTATETPPYASVYSATKAALVAFSRSLHAELSSEGIHVTALAPGLVDTPGTGWAPDDVRDRMIPAEDVAAAVLFLLGRSPRCFVPALPLVTAGAGMHELVDWRSFG
ncbi:NAD(P)-dependent dehydrogenase (short-subunit alcohol dehydrogenase family) [Nocardioides luteus]|uniref:Oxidoreductase n=1 Tax=Nocardioides luteus TaxID=1844 RepID=A0ABQ5SSE0_9ACTN|nr:SDR family oxidoreductase [Nocardioides luteus]MDR7313060.1 NAD(P)-dependent dehydrogenase (short-subunit alcohol dehydrogenase family) [Nocardioides luteus]GGR44400.1 putative oxidoreductase [Nocardioides luteus]GLJ66121.1 putative oxidoreductase [Nocardioides luteus]